MQARPVCTSADKSSLGRWVVNLLSKHLLSEEISVLEKGLNFAPAPQRVPYKEIIAAVEKGVRKGGY